MTLNLGLFPTSEETKRRDPGRDCDLVVSVHYCSTWARFTVQPMGLVMKIWWWNTEKQLGETIPIPWTYETTYHEHDKKKRGKSTKIHWTLLTLPFICISMGFFGGKSSTVDGCSEVKDLHGIPWCVADSVLLNHPVHYIIYITHLFDLCK